MAQDLSNLDWTHIRAFLAVAETGSLSAAARKTGQSQPTLGRHIKAAEASLRASLFTRTATGLQLTDMGQLLLEPAQDMAAASARLQTLAAGQDMRLSGTVRITASVVVSHTLLPDIIAQMRQAEPDIAIALVPSDTPENLLFREADIAIRMFRPTQLDIVTRKVAEHPMALYAAHALLDRFGQPRSLDELAALPFVGFDRSDLILRYMRDMGFDITKDFFGVRCDDQAAFWQLICAGCGVGAMQTRIGDAEPRVQKLTFQPALPSLPLWLATPKDLHANRRVRRIWEMLAASFTGAGSPAP